MIYLIALCCTVKHTVTKIFGAFSGVLRKLNFSRQGGVFFVQFSRYCLLYFLFYENDRTVKHGALLSMNRRFFPGKGRGRRHDKIPAVRASVVS